MSRWLVTLALAVVALPGPADAKPQLRVERSTRTVTTSRGLVDLSRAPRIPRLPASIELERDGVLVATDRGFRVRHSLGRAQSVSWIATVGPRVVIGYAARPGGQADSMMAIDHVTGQLAWRRSVDSLAAAELTGDWLAIERAGTLDVVDARTGHTVGTAPITGRSIQSVSRSSGGDLHVKTRGDLVAIDGRTGAVRWVQPSSSVGNAAVTPGAVVDAWVDREAHRYGVVSYDPASGRRLGSIDLGATGGWYDLERVELAPDGPTDVLVSALFAIS